MPQLISRTLRLFLDSIGRRDEYEFYLRKFQSTESVAFALVVPDEESLQESGELMAFDLHFLLRLELKPLVLLSGETAASMFETLQQHAPFARQIDIALKATETDWRQTVDPLYAEGLLPVIVDSEMDLERDVRSLIPTVARRVHLLRARGMLRDTQGNKVFYHSTRAENLHQICEEDIRTLELTEVWQRYEPTLHISISSPLYLLQEMFTVRGMGSIIRPGSIIRHHESLAEVDNFALEDLIRQAFGRRLLDPDSLEACSDFFIELTYRGAVLLENLRWGKYLSKYAVGQQARGEGLAQELWEKACAPQEKLFWRSRRDNPINHWYSRHAHGHHSTDEWTVFWRGILPRDLPEVIEYAVTRPSDFED